MARNRRRSRRPDSLLIAPRDRLQLHIHAMLVLQMHAQPISQPRLAATSTPTRTPRCRTSTATPSPDRSATAALSTLDRSARAHWRLVDVRRRETARNPHARRVFRARDRVALRRLEVGEQRRQRIDGVALGERSPRGVPQTRGA